jgi:hypothetical protein
MELKFINNLHTYIHSFYILYLILYILVSHLEFLVSYFIDVLTNIFHLICFFSLYIFYLFYCYFLLIKPFPNIRAGLFLYEHFLVLTLSGGVFFFIRLYFIYLDVVK